MRLPLALAAFAVVSTPLFAQTTCNEGCTPGYWKNHVERWDGLGGDDFTQTVVASMSFNGAFGVTEVASGLADTATLHDALLIGGGGLVALNRHASAALASADAVCYPLTVGQVIDAYQSAVLGTAGIGATKDLFEMYNEAGCPLSNSTPPTPPDIFCIGDQGDCPCGNESLLGGCENSTGLGARLDTSGTTSVLADDLVLVATQLPPNTSVLFHAADTLRRDVFMDGLLCVGGPMSKIYRLPPIINSGAEGVAMLGPGLVALSNTKLVPIVGGILPGDTWYFQTFYRDMSSCGHGANTSNAIGVMFTN